MDSIKSIALERLFRRPCWFLSRMLCSKELCIIIGIYPINCSNVTLQELCTPALWISVTVNLTQVFLVPPLYIANLIIVWYFYRSYPEEKWKIYNMHSPIKHNDEKNRFTMFHMFLYTDSILSLENLAGCVYRLLCIKLSNDNHDIWNVSKLLLNISSCLWVIIDSKNGFLV